MRRDPARRINDAMIEMGKDKAEQLEADVLAIVCITVLRDGRAATSDVSTLNQQAIAKILHHAATMAEEGYEALGYEEGT